MKQLKFCFKGKLKDLKEYIEKELEKEKLEKEEEA
jgi:hypothetical protein